MGLHPRNIPFADERSGELLLDQQKFQESVERFDKSLELDQNKYVFSAMFLSLFDQRANARL